MVLFSNSATPILGTSIIAEVKGQDIGNVGGQVNNANGCQVFFTGPNTISIRTGQSGVFIDSSNIPANYTSGYYCVYCYY